MLSQARGHRAILALALRANFPAFLGMLPSLDVSAAVQEFARTVTFGTSGSNRS